jgi:hypothetical protein
VRLFEITLFRSLSLEVIIMPEIERIAPLLLATRQQLVLELELAKARVEVFALRLEMHDAQIIALHKLQTGDEYDSMTGVIKRVAKPAPEPVA